jgi:type IV secretory pathway VirB4 component
LYADDIVIVQKNEDVLQRSVHHLNQICKQYNFKISKEKTKVMAFWGKHPIRSKIVLQYQLLEHRTLKNKTRKETRLKFYKAMAIPALMYGSEIWAPAK